MPARALAPSPPFSVARAVALCGATSILAACGGAATAPARLPGAAQTAAARAGAGQAPAKAPARDQVAAARASADAAEERLLDTLSNSPAHKALARPLLTGGVLQTRGGAPRAQVEPQSFRVRELPLVAMPAPLVASAAPAVLPPGDAPAELVVDWRGVAPERVGSTYTSVRVSLKGAPYARLRIGGNETTIGSRADGGLYVSCSTPEATSPVVPPSTGKGKKAAPPGAEPRLSAARPPNRGGAITPARWEMLTLGKTAQLTVVDAWFDPGACRAVVVPRTTGVARPLPGGVLYGYRASCQPQPGADAADCGARESMVILAPALTHLALSATTDGTEASRGMFTRATVPLQRGGGASLVSRVDGGVLRDWLGEPAGVPRPRQLLVGVEVVQGVGDREATAVSYVEPLE
ncbi:MAG: hypothetical protein WKG00_36905 [Polyangiaceae bacterium]